MGIDPEPGKYFSRTGFAGGHEQTVVAVLNKQYDAGVTWTSGIGDAAAGYTRGTLRMMVDKKMLDMKDLRIIWKSRPILNGPLTVRKRYAGNRYQADMLAFHLALPTAYPDIYHSVRHGQRQGLGAGEARGLPGVHRHAATGSGAAAAPVTGIATLEAAYPARRRARFIAGATGTMLLLAWPAGHRHGCRRLIRRR